ncbi:olfactory receptor 6F1-like [Gastrophryne carolinensis]
MLPFNQTVFILVGFKFSAEIQSEVFFILLVIYLLSIFGNLAILAVICLERSLHTPMYLLLSSLALEDIGFISCTVPMYLIIMATGNGDISKTECIIQLYFYMSFGSISLFLLAFMSVDRYVAISDPLRYQSIITNQTCLCLILISWGVGLFAFIYPIVLLSNLFFCGPFVVNHFFCEGSVLGKISCSDTSFFYIIFTTFAATIILVSCIIIIVSYSYVIAAVMKIPSTSGKRKAFSTCSSHLCAVILTYGTIMFLYVRPADSISSDINKAVNILNSVISPFSNPFIYSWRNKKVQNVLWKLLCLSSFKAKWAH